MKKLTMLLLAALMVLSLAVPGFAAEEDETAETTEAAETQAEETAEESKDAEETEQTEETEDAEETEQTEQTRPRREASEGPTEGTCGDNLTWRFSGGTLAVTGSGEMAEGAPWAHLADRVETLILSGGITTVAEEAFKDFDSLTAVDFGDALKEAGPQAFMGCDALEFIRLPATFRLFARESFRECSSLKTIYCEGNMPSFKGNCLWTGHYITIYHPLDNPWPEEAVEQLQENFGGRIEILPAAGEEFQDFAQVMEEEGEKVRAIAAQLETEPVTKPETEPATEPETEPTLPPTTEPVTEPTIAPTQAPTVPTEEVPAFTGPDWQEEMEMTEPLETNDAPGGASWIGIALIVGVLTFLVIGALIVRSMSRKGGRYSE